MITERTEQEQQWNNDEITRLIREDRERIIQELRKVAEFKVDEDTEYEDVVSRVIHLENKEIDDLIDKIMEE